MTTIAYRAGVLAGDSRGTRSGWIDPAPFLKVRKAPDGSLIAFTGAPAACMPLMSWIETGEGEKPGFAEDGDTVIHVHRDGSVHVYDGAPIPMEMAAEFYAWGSGFPAALAAMHAGASAEEAVRIACLVDPSSGGPIESVRLDRVVVTESGADLQPKSVVVDPASQRFGFTRDDYVQ